MDTTRRNHTEGEAVRVASVERSAGFNILAWVQAHEAHHNAILDLMHTVPAPSSTKEMITVELAQCYAAQQFIMCHEHTESARSLVGNWRASGVDYPIYALAALARAATETASTSAWISEQGSKAQHLERYAS